MNRFDHAIEGACEDQRADLRTFAETGDEEAMLRVHFDACDACDRAVDRIIGIRDGLPAAPAALERPAPRQGARWPILAAAAVLVFGLLGFGALAFHFVFAAGEAAVT